MWTSERSGTVRFGDVTNPDSLSEETGVSTSHAGELGQAGSGVVRVQHRPMTELEAMELYYNDNEAAPPYVAQSQYFEDVAKRDAHGHRAYDVDPVWRGYVNARYAKSNYTG